MFYHFTGAYSMKGDPDPLPRVVATGAKCYSSVQCISSLVVPKPSNARKQKISSTSHGINFVNVYVMRTSILVFIRHGARLENNSAYI